MLSSGENLTALMNLSGTWIDSVHECAPLDELILDLDSSVSETPGEQQGSAYNLGNSLRRFGVAEVGEALVAYNAAREIDQDRSQGGSARKACDASNGRGGGAEGAVRRDPRPYPAVRRAGAVGTRVERTPSRKPNERENRSGDSTPRTSQQALPVYGAA